MSEHAHAVHGHEHAHGHDEGHGQGHGHEEHWGDYNAQPQKPSTLPPVSALALTVFGASLAAMLLAITIYSFKLLHAPKPAPEVHTEHPHGEEH